MSSYKVAQDVEAEDKLLGPFSFKQFIYLIAVAMGGAMAWGFWQIFPPLAIIPLPIMIFFGALALPLRKDQPMETYLAAILSFYLKPKKRLWVPDGVESLVEITAPKRADESRTNHLSENEAQRRLSYLANISDTRGWSIRNVNAAGDKSSMVEDVYNEAQQTSDVFDETGGVSQSFDSMISKSDASHREQLVNSMRAPQPSQPAPATPPAQSAPDPYQTLGATQDEPQGIRYNPYPTSIRQSVISPLSEQPIAPPAQTPVEPQPPVAVAQPQPAPPAQTPAEPQPPSPPAPEPAATDITTSENTVSPDIINLAHNSDLSIETMAREAERIEKRHHKDENEVVISLR